jgi:hypothetical protein
LDLVSRDQPVGVQFLRGAQHSCAKLRRKPTFSGITQFGYVMETSFVGFHTLDYATGIENYCVGLNGAVGQGTGSDVSCLATSSAPEPSSSMLCGVGALFLAAGILFKGSRRWLTFKQ